MSVDCVIYVYVLCIHFHYFNCLLVIMRVEVLSRLRRIMHTSSSFSVYAMRVLVEWARFIEGYQGLVLIWNGFDLDLWIIKIILSCFVNHLFIPFRVLFAVKQVKLLDSAIMQMD